MHLTKIKKIGIRLLSEKGSKSKDIDTVFDYGPERERLRRRCRHRNRNRTVTVPYRTVTVL